LGFQPETYDLVDVAISPPALAVVRADIADEIRKELARELHDTVAQNLTAMVVQIEQFKEDQYGRETAIRELATLQHTTREILNQVRELLHDLRSDDGLAAGFADIVRDGLLRRLAAQTGIKTRIKVSRRWPERLGQQTAHSLYRIAQEALTNVRNHSGASAVTVTLDNRGGHLVMVISDNGHGHSPLAERGHGTGIIGMEERAVLLGGECTVSRRPGRGTTVKVSFGWSGA
jgi:signal transduction histidine kinase